MVEPRSESNGGPSGRKRWRIGLIVLAIAAAVVAGKWWGSQNPDRTGNATTPATESAPVTIPLPPLTASPFLNTGPEASLVGSDACRACHAEASESYARSGMSRSMAEVDPAAEPEDAVFEHHVSGRRLSVHRDEGKLLMRDELTDVPNHGDITLANHELRYVVGSGHFSKTYLAEIDGFLAEAPLTWFASTGQWGMSPGYDHAAQEGFARPIIERCIGCHAGSTEAVDGAVQKLRFHELAIGCERCHGPGSLHAESRNSEQAAAPDANGAESIDHTIVNPAHLSRDLAEAICQQCHLSADAEVTARGRSLTDFRPGLPVQDFLLFFRRKAPPTSMKVVGHSDQMALSRCYTESTTLTCTTCHNPHETPTVAERPAYYRGICLECHQLQDCDVDPAIRAVQSAENDCTHCHMPVGPTEIIHLAFTHHRIGIHTDQPDVPQPSEVAVELEPVHDISTLGEIDHQRAFGLAYYDHAWLDGGVSLEGELLKARSYLLDARERGLRDGQVDAALAQIAVFAGNGSAVELATAALQDPLLPSDPRSGALSLLASRFAASGSYGAAATPLEELLKLRRNAPNWIQMGNLQIRRKNYAAAIQAFEQAVAVDPRQIEAHRTLAQLYEAIGKASEAQRQSAIADRFEQIRTAASATSSP